MRIVLTSSEAVPFSKTGGLADVAAALPKALAHAGHEVWLIVPHYPQAARRRGIDENSFVPVGERVEVPIRSRLIQADILQTQLPDTNVTTLLVHQPDYFDRHGLYQDQHGQDYPDNCERFVFFSRAVMETVRMLNLRPHVIHANDWQTGLVPALLDIQFRNLPGFEQTSSVFTIHNMAYQGHFWHWDMELTGLDWRYFNHHQMEFWGHLNLLKTGIVFADEVTTVSPSYAREIQTPEYGCGLEGTLSFHRGKITGILNGVDTGIWNPAIDPHLPENYSVRDLSGKERCKSFLQQKLGLPARPDVPLLGMISRMSEQKGLDLVDQSAEFLLKDEAQIAFLGMGERRYETILADLARRFPGKVSATVGFDEVLAHQIEAGADLFLMPSRYEPCGLNQMYSLLYGTVPVVRCVGGLADTVVEASAENFQAGTANGFRCERHAPTEFYRQVHRATELFHHDAARWRELMENGMRGDFSWERSAAGYVSIYEQAAGKYGYVPAAPAPAGRDGSQNTGNGKQHHEARERAAQS